MDHGGKMDKFEFNFDYWAELYKKDPDDFERQKAIVLDSEIKKYETRCPEEAKRIRSVLWNLNTRLSLIKNDTERYNVVVEEFWRQFFKFKEATKELTMLTSKKV